MESLAAINLLHDAFPDLKIRFINVLDLLKLRSPEIDPRGLSDAEFNSYFTTDKPILFAYHGFEGLIRDIFFTRQNRNVLIHGYREEGDITTPFDMRVLNELDRFHLAKDVIQHVPAYAEKAAALFRRWMIRCNITTTSFGQTAKIFLKFRSGLGNQLSNTNRVLVQSLR